MKRYDLISAVGFDLELLLSDVLYLRSRPRLLYEMHDWEWLNIDLEMLEANS